MANKTEETKPAATTAETTTALPDVLTAESAAKMTEASGSEFFSEVARAGGFGAANEVIAGDLDLKGLQIAAAEKGNKTAADALTRVRAVFAKYQKEKE